MNNDGVISNELDLPKETPVKKERRIELFKGEKGKYYWRKVVIANGKIVGDGSQGYSTKFSLERAWEIESKFTKMEYFEGPVWVDN